MQVVDWRLRLTLEHPQIGDNLILDLHLTEFAFVSDYALHVPGVSLMRTLDH